MAIASCLVDTNILLRVARRSDPQHKLVDAALAKASAGEYRAADAQATTSWSWVTLGVTDRKPPL